LHDSTAFLYRLMKLNTSLFCAVSSTCVLGMRRAEQLKRQKNEAPSAEARSQVFLGRLRLAAPFESAPFFTFAFRSRSLIASFRTLISVDTVVLDLIEQSSMADLE